MRLSLPLLTKMSGCPGAWHFLSALIARRVLLLSRFLLCSSFLLAVAPFYNFICNLSLFAFALGSFPLEKATGKAGKKGFTPSDSLYFGI